VQSARMAQAVTGNVFGYPGLCPWCFTPEHETQEQYRRCRNSFFDRHEGKYFICPSMACEAEGFASELGLTNHLALSPTCNVGGTINPLRGQAFHLKRVAVRSDSGIWSLADRSAEPEVIRLKIPFQLTWAEVWSFGSTSAPRQESDDCISVSSNCPPAKEGEDGKENVDGEENVDENENASEKL